MAKLGIIILGQTPRPDVLATYARFAPRARLLTKGALDGLMESEIDRLAEQDGEYPLLVILRDGSTREISMSLLKPLLEQVAKDLAQEGAASAVLFCAGNFPDLKSPIPIVYPGRVVPAVAASLCTTQKIALITPNPGQAEPAKAHWQAKGFEVMVEVASPKDEAAFFAAAQKLNNPEFDLLVLDCMGFSPDMAQAIRKSHLKPVICPQSLVARMAAELAGE
jgi:protein AroM